MCIQMIGIDHNSASVEYRELFALTKMKSSQVMEAVGAMEGVQGCVVLSTCNRTEVWVSGLDHMDQQITKQIYYYLCGLKGIEHQKYRDLFCCRRSEAAVRHLFEVAGGLQSRILGEDQIITQVKEALTLAREYHCADNVLETLFRQAVTAGKKVKSSVRLTVRNHSVIDQAIEQVEAQLFSLKGKRCMVIGNGAMGKRAALSLADAGADVTITVRQYRSGIVDIPKGCNRINYGERMAYLPQCDLVVSATVSPNTTIKYEETAPIKLKRPVVFIDLAVPRDIDQRIETLDGVFLYDIDSFQSNRQDQVLKDSVEKAKALLAAQMEEFFQWYECRDMAPGIRRIGLEVAGDLEQRMQKIIKQLPIEQAERQELKQQLDAAAVKVITKMMFGLRGTISQPAFRECMEGLERVYETKQ